MVPDSVEGDRVEPDEETLVRAPAPQAFVGAEKGLLGQVLRLGEAAGHPVGEIEDGGLVGLAVPFENGSDDLSFLVMIHASAENGIFSRCARNPLSFVDIMASFSAGLAVLEMRICLSAAIRPANPNTVHLI